MRTLYKFLRAGVVSALFVQVGFAQKENVGIGTTKPDQSAILDLSSTNKGLLMPRVSLQQRNSIQNPANGLIVYQTDMLSGFYYFDGKEWKSIGAETAQNSVADAFNWGLTGNAGTSAANFIGTTDAQPLRFRIQGINSGRIEENNVFLGFTSGNLSSSGAYNSSFGTGSMANNTTGYENTAIGFYSMLANTTGAQNVGVGSSSLRSNTTGALNTAIGTNALNNNTTGSFNFALGGNSMLANTTGNNNAAVGIGSLQGNTVGSQNLALGTFAGQNATGSSNIFIGYAAGSNETGNNKIYVSNSNTSTPLIYGVLNSDFLAIGGVDATAAKRDNLSSSYGLLVRKGILTEKIKVATMSTSDWADYVFENDYKILTIEEVESYIKENKHLPNVPTTTEIISNGNDLMKTDAKLLEKIEELTLYIIALNKRIKELEIKK